MKFLRVGQRLINLAQVTDIYFGKDRVIFFFAVPELQVNDENATISSQEELEFTEELAGKLRAFFAEHWPIGDVGTFDL